MSQSIGIYFSPNDISDMVIQITFLILCYSNKNTINFFLFEGCHFFATGVFFLQRVTFLLQQVSFFLHTVSFFLHTSVLHLYAHIQISHLNWATMSFYLKIRLIYLKFIFSLVVMQNQQPFEHIAITKQIDPAVSIFSLSQCCY